MVTVACARCGVLFERGPRQGKRKFCGRVCYLAHRAEKARNATATPVDAERQRAYARAYYERNREKKLAATRDYRTRNPGKTRAFEKAWREANPDRHRDHKRKAAAKRRAAMLGCDSEEFTYADVVATYGTDCHICAGPIDFSAPRSAGKPGWQKSFWPDHVVALANGGPNTLANVRPAHALCNLRKNARA